MHVVVTLCLGLLIIVNLIILGLITDYIKKTNQLLVALSYQVDMLETVTMQNRQLHEINNGHLNHMYYKFTGQQLNEDQTKGASL